VPCYVLNREALKLCPLILGIDSEIGKTLNRAFASRDIMGAVRKTVPSGRRSRKDVHEN
jgi:hypothetical protein